MHEQEAAPPIRNLQPAVTISDARYVLKTELMGSVRQSQLGDLVASLRGERDTVVSALDFLFDGF